MQSLEKRSILTMLVDDGHLIAEQCGVKRLSLVRLVGFLLKILHKLETLINANCCGTGEKEERLLPESHHGTKPTMVFLQVSSE